MWIMTAQGWKQLQPREYTKASEPTAYNGVPAPYVGEFPSRELCELVNAMKDRDMKFFDDGIRMVYGKADRRVVVENAKPDHPIKYPPKGFEHINR